MINFGIMVRFIYKQKLLLIGMVFMVILMAFQCQKYSHSPCINQKIVQFKTECCNSGANVREYWFQSQSVFVFNPGNCGGDLPSYVLNETCDTLGFLGGITGNQSINGISFGLAEEKGILWEN